MDLLQRHPFAVEAPEHNAPALGAEVDRQVRRAHPRTNPPENSYRPDPTETTVAPSSTRNSSTPSASSTGLPPSETLSVEGTWTVAVVLGGTSTSRTNRSSSIRQELEILPRTASYSPLANVRSPPGCGRMTMWP